MKPNIYIIGAGVISREHMKAVKTLPNGVGEVHVTDVNPDSLKAFGEEFPEVTTWASTDEMLAQPAGERDIVIIATPPAFHAKPAKAALESGRHVLCEKPLGLSLEEIEPLIELAEQKDLLFGCCSARFSKLEVTGHIEKALKEGAFGTPYAMTFRHKGQRGRSGIEFQPGSHWFLQKKLSGGGACMDWGVYDISYLIGLFEPDSVEILQCTMATPETDHGLPEDVIIDVDHHVRATILFHWKDKPSLPVNYERASCTNGEPQQIVELEGTKAAAKWHWIPWNGGFEENQFHLWWTTDEANKPKTEEIVFDGTKETHPHSRPLHGLVQRLEGVEETPGHFGRDALLNFRVLRGLYTVAETGKARRIER